MQLKIIKGDISTIECDAIVCSTSLNLSPMGQIDTAIHQKAGIDFTKFCTEVIGHCDTGKCVVTNGYNLPCKYVIHTVVPFSHVDSAAHILANCYREAIEQAIYKECSSVAFPLLGSGGNGFTVKKAIDVALNRFEICTRNEDSSLTIYFVLFDDETKDMAFARAKEIIQPQYLELDHDSPDKFVLDKELDIEFTELVTGFRIRQNQNGVFIDIYLYDSLSSGAGYAVSIESSIQELLRKTRDLLSGCTCDSACHKCLKHYRNQYIHGSLDRKAALDLLEWGSNGERTPAIPYQKQQYMLRSLAQILQLSGVTIHLNQAPIEAEGRYSKKKVVVYPSMWAKPSASNTIFVSDSYLKYAKPYALKTIVDNL